MVGVIIKSKKMYITAMTGKDAEEVELNSQSLTALVEKFSENVLDGEESVATLNGFANVSDVPSIKNHIDEVIKVFMLMEDKWKVQE